MEILERRIHKILARISNVTDFRRIAADVLRTESSPSTPFYDSPELQGPPQKTDVAVSGLSGSARALFTAGLWQSLRRPLIVVTSQDRGVESLATDIAYFHGELTTNGAQRVCS